MGVAHCIAMVWAASPGQRRGRGCGRVRDPLCGPASERVLTRWFNARTNAAATGAAHTSAIDARDRAGGGRVERRRLGSGIRRHAIAPTRRLAGNTCERWASVFLDTISH